MWELRVPAIAEDPWFDPNRPGTSRARSDFEGGAPFAAFLMGPVRVEYGQDPAGTSIDLGDQDPADLARGIIRSNTGEVRMDTPRGVCVIDAPRAQGVAGFLAEAGPVATEDLVIDMQNGYGAVLAVSLDDRPLAESGRILLQITTQSRPDGWKDERAEREDGTPVLRILDTGGGGRNGGRDRWMVKNTRGTVTVRNGRLGKATLTDAHFYPRGAVPAERRGGELAVTLPPEAMYLILE